MQRKSSLQLRKKEKQDNQLFSSVIQFSFHQEPKKKTSTFQRISEKTVEIPISIKEKMKNNMKVQRKDTAQTNQENNINELKNLQNYDSNQLDKLVESSKQDPFLRYKLKAFVKNQLKTLVKGSKGIQNIKNTVQNEKKSETNNKLKQQQILNLLSDSVILTNSIKSNSQIASSQSLSNKSKGPSTPLCDRLINQFFQEQNKSLFLKQQSGQLPSNLTTLKSQQKKNKTSKFKFLRQLSLKQPQQISEQ